MHDTVIIRYAEIFLKSEPVRKRFEDLLLENMRRRLARCGLAASFERKRLRIYAKSKQAKEVAEALSTVFGVASVSPAFETSSDAGDVLSACALAAKETLSQDDTFAVRAERTGKHPYSSMELAAKAGERIISETGAKVDLTTPDKTIHIEVRDERAYVYTDRIKGAGGMPYGSQGRLVALLSAGIDSPVAAYLMMRRGCTLTFLHLGVDEDVRDIVSRLELYSDRPMRLVSIPHTEILSSVSRKAGRYTCVVCKRIMHRLAEKLAEKEGAYGIVTGDSIGQVASQTVENLSTIELAEIPVYRPLIGMDKEEITCIARSIGTYEHMKNVPCPFVPQKPATKSDIEEIERIEKETCIDDIIEDAAARFIFKK